VYVRRHDTMRESMVVGATFKNDIISTVLFSDYGPISGSRSTLAYEPPHQNTPAVVYSSFSIDGVATQARHFQKAL
jgi:hypothetical protein